MTKKILMIVGDFVETIETFTPYFTMKMMGFTVDVVCPGKVKGDTVMTAVHEFTTFQTYEEKRGHCFTLTCTFTEVNPTTYDALYIPGGRAPEYLRTNPKCVEMVKHFMTANKPVAAMCHGVQLLVPTGGITGRKVTCFPACEIECTLAGCDFVKVPKDECVVDGNLITCPTWLACPTMMLKFVEMCGVKIMC